MEQKRLDLYTFSEHQLILLNTCINAWRGSTFWALMYMQSRLFHAENVDSIYRELQAQPAQYDQIMERYYHRHRSGRLSALPLLRRLSGRAGRAATQPG